MNKNLQAHGKVFLATILIGSSFIVSKNVSDAISPLSVTLLRFIIATIFLTPFIIFNKEHRSKIKPTFSRAMIVSLFYSLFFIFFFTSLKYTTAVNTGTLYTLVPLMTALISIVVFKQKLTLKQFYIYFIGIISSLIVISEGSFESFLNMKSNWGDIIFLLAALSMSLYAVSMKFLSKEGDSSFVFVFLTMLGGVIYLSIGTFIIHEPLNWRILNRETLINIIYLSTATTLLTSYLNQSATVTLGPKKTMAYVYLNPAIVALIQFIFYKDKVNIWTIVGIMVSSIATIIILKRENKF